MSRQFLIVLVFLGISAVSWVFGKMKEKAEAQEAQQRARIHRDRLERLQASDKSADEQSTGPQPSAQPSNQPSKQQLAMQRKQQLAQLRQERLAALRAEMQARLQNTGGGQPQQAPRPRQAPPRQQQRAVPTPQPQQRRPAPQPQPVRQQQSRSPQPQRTIGALPKAPSFSHDHLSLAELGTHTQHGTHPIAEGESVVHRLVTDAATTKVTRRAKGSLNIGSATAQDWRRAIVMSELLAPPVALREG